MHFMKPISGARERGLHVLLWCDIAPAPRKRRGGSERLIATRKVVTAIIDEKDGGNIYESVPFDDGNHLAEILTEGRHGFKSLQLWLVRGWTDFVLSGLAQLADQKRLTWKWISLDGARLLLDGKLDGKPIKITSLAAWCGSRWDMWRDSVLQEKFVMEAVRGAGVTDLEQQIALGSVLTILGASRVFQTGAVRLTMAAQARAWWRAVLGPRYEMAPDAKAAKRKGAQPKKEIVVAPYPFRPSAAVSAERQCCYGLQREQYMSGAIDGPVEVWDMKCSYLAALVSTPVPVACLPLEVTPRISDMAAWAPEHTMCALVHLDSPDAAYPVRIGGKPGRAVGSFWTWLCGVELAQALHMGRVRACQFCWRWRHQIPDQREANRLLLSIDDLGRKGYPAHRAYMRSMYSSLVGQWARWSRIWKREDRPNQWGRWSTWTGYDSDTGELTRWRSVAGIVEKRVDIGDAPGALPIMYATVLSTARSTVDHAAQVIGWQHVLAICADALWLTKTGADRLRRLIDADPLDIGECRQKEVYDRVWLDGNGHAVVEREGKRWPVMTGIPTYAYVDETGRSRWQVSSPWMERDIPDANSGVRVTGATFDAGRLVRDCSHKPIVAYPWLELNSAQLREELLVPLRPRVAAEQGGIDDVT